MIEHASSTQVASPVAGGDARVLAEMTKPGGSAPALIPVLQLSQVNKTYTVGSSIYVDPANGLPGLSNIDPQAFNLKGNCTCNNCPCYFPYQAELLNYDSDRIVNSKETNYRIGIFNNAPWTGPQTLYAVNLK